MLAKIFANDLCQQQKKREKTESQKKRGKFALAKAISRVSLVEKPKRKAAKKVDDSIAVSFCTLDFIASSVQTHLHTASHRRCVCLCQIFSNDAVRCRMRVNRKQGEKFHNAHGMGMERTAFLFLPCHAFGDVCRCFCEVLYGCASKIHPRPIHITHTRSLYQNVELFVVL